MYVLSQSNFLYVEGVTHKVRHLHFFCADLWWISTSTTTKILSEDPGNGQTVRHLYIFSHCHVAKSEVVFQAGRRIVLTCSRLGRRGQRGIVLLLHCS